MDCGSSRRGRGNARGETAATATKKKDITAVIKEAAAEEMVVEGGGGLLVAEAAAGEVEELWSGVDEGMSWATCWFPFWEVEDSLYGDVWDYDIWGLKATTIMPPNH